MEPTHPPSDHSFPLPQLPGRAPDSHKGDYGHALLIGGSQGMFGAISLAGMSALRSGAGLVTVAVPAVCLSTVASFEPSYMTVPLACDADGHIVAAAEERITALAASASCLGCGPGLGRTPQLTQLVQRLYQSLARPMILDADALYALAQPPFDLASHAGPRVLTPHPGEFRRLIGADRLPRADLESRATQLAAANDLIMVLKGHQTLVTDGARSSHNATGNPGMATGGSGDVLTGMITALVGQGLGLLPATQLAVHVHGLAGDLAAEALGQVSLIASDLIDWLPPAYQRVVASQPSPDDSSAAER